MNYIQQYNGSIGNIMQMTQQWQTSKMNTNLNSTNGQVVGILQSGENGINYLRTVDPNGLPSTSTGLHAGPTVITLPIQFANDKPGDPPQTVQIQVLPTMPTMSQQSQGTKYQMTQIPVQNVHQGATLLWCTSQSQSADGTMQLQISDQQGGLPENVTVVTALQPSDIQLIQTSTSSHILKNDMSLKRDQDDQIPSSLIKSEARSPQGVEENSQQEDIQHSLEWGNQQQDQQEHLANDYINLQSFLKFNNTNNQIKQEVVQINDLSNENGDALQITEDNPQVIEEVDDNDPKAKRKKKYKKKPPKPKKPKPGQVQIATALDGTTLFCCPECHMAYPDKEMLEQHLVMHKIERRFICDICGAGLKRKEHLERHKMGHSPERPFICNVCSKGFKRKEHLNLHVVIHSGQKTEICGECGKGFYRKDHLRKHVRSHLMRRMKEELNQQNHTFNNIALTSALQSQVHHVTIQMPTSQIQLPVQIQVPQHQLKMDSNINDESDLNQVSTVVLPSAEDTNNMTMVSPNNVRNCNSQNQLQSQDEDQHAENIIMERHSQQQHEHDHDHDHDQRMFIEHQNHQLQSKHQQQSQQNMLMDHQDLHSSNNNNNNNNNDDKDYNMHE